MTKIIAASCCKLQQVSPQPIWAAIQAEQPDALLLMGDNIYLDRDFHAHAGPLANELDELYRQQKAEPSFAGLLADMQARHKPVVAIYDDHDFIGNDRYGGGEDPALGLAARQALINALPTLRTGTDVYGRLSVGPVEVIVLDERFYRRKAADSRFDRDAVLGAAQWAWLEQTLAELAGARFVLLVSSSTVHRFGALQSESWEDYHAAFQRLHGLLARRAGRLVVSGDIHENDCYDDSGLVEFVTSGVARRGLLWGADRANYGVFRFDADGLDFELRSNRVRDRLSGRVALANWRLP